jgi:hypothetical protein
MSKKRDDFFKESHYALNGWEKRHQRTNLGQPMERIK